MDACAQGQTHYTVAQAIQRCVGYTRFPVEEQHQEEDSKTCCDSDCERCVPLSRYIINFPTVI